MEKQERLEATVCREIGARTGGEILIGVVGPVRTGKSTLIKQFMEQLVLPAIENDDARLRARDELPQSAAGRTIMTTEPKFIPENAVPLQLEGGGECRIRLIDCVGYMVDGAMGHEENEKPRMVKSPWFDVIVSADVVRLHPYFFRLDALYAQCQVQLFGEKKLGFGRIIHFFMPFFLIGQARTVV